LFYFFSGVKYFELSQEIYETGDRFLISSQKPSILNINPTDSLLLWSLEPENVDNCGVYSSIIFKISDNGLVTSRSSPESGRFIPLLNKEIFGNDHFYLWTNTSICDSPTNGITSMPFKRHISHDNRHNETEAPLLKDAKLFVSNNEVYVILAQNYNRVTKSYHTNSTVLSLNSKTGQWSPIQQIETFGVHSIDVISYGKHKTTFAAFANDFNTRANDIHSVIMEWDPLSHKFEINSVIKTSSPSAVLFVESHSGQLFAIFANEKSKLFENDCGPNDYSLYTQPINVYHYDSKSFNYIQSIDINGVISLETFIVSNETYLVAASRLLGTTYVLQLRGYNMFEVILSFATPGVQNVKSFWSNSGKLHLAIASSKSGHSKILTAIINGSHNINKYLSIEDLLRDSNLK
jgi:hypothetical protein